MLACMARRKKERELSAPLSLNSLHALTNYVSLPGTRKQGESQRKGKSEIFSLGNWDLPTFSLPLLHTSFNACKAGVVKLANDAGILQLNLTVKMKYFADFAQGSARVLRAYVYSAFHELSCSSYQNLGKIDPWTQLAFFYKLNCNISAPNVNVTSN